MIAYYFVSTIYVLVCLVLLLVILLQQGKGDMGSAFGGGRSKQDRAGFQLCAWKAIHAAGDRCNH